MAAQKKADTIAFLRISTDIFRYPKAEACQIAVDAGRQWLADQEHPRCVIFCCFETVDAILYRNYLGTKPLGGDTIFV